MSNSMEVIIAGNEAAYVRALQKAQAAETKVEEGMKKIGDEAKRTEVQVDKLSKKMQAIKPPPAPPPIKPPPVPPPIQIEKHTVALRAAAAAGEQAFGGAALASVSSFAAGLLSVAAAAGLVKTALAAAKAERDAAVGSLRELGDPDVRLNQIAKSPADLVQMQKRADAAAVKYGIDPKVAREVLFNTRSGGFEQDYEKIMAGKNVASPVAASAMALELQNLFPGQKVKPLEGVNMALAAATSSKLPMEKIAAAIPIAAEGAGPAGASPEEVFAISSQFANVFAGDTSFAARLKAFGSKVSMDPSMKGKGLLNAVAMLRGKSETERAKWIGGSQEVNAAYEKLNEFYDPMVAGTAAMGKVRSSTGSSDSPFEQGIGRADVNPDFVGRNAVASSEVKRNVAQRYAYASDAAMAEAAQNNVGAEMDKRKINGVNRYIANGMMSGARMFTDDPATVSAAGVAGANWYGLGVNYSQAVSMDSSVDEQTKILLLQKETAQKQAEAADKQSKAADLQMRAVAPRSAAQRAEVGRQREN